ncbi:hypothetical protein B484DRAFT_399299, partial [Ochromonadaceae sp. CCMP2298]
MPPKKQKVKAELKTSEPEGEIKIGLHLTSIKKKKGVPLPATLMQEAAPNSASWFNFVTPKVYFPIALLDSVTNAPLTDVSVKLTMTLTAEGMDPLEVTTPHLGGVYWFSSVYVHVPGAVTFRFFCEDRDDIEPLEVRVPVTRDPSLGPEEVPKAPKIAKTKVDKVTKAPKEKENASAGASASAGGASGGGGGGGPHVAGWRARSRAEEVQVEMEVEVEEEDVEVLATEEAHPLQSVLPFPRIITLDAHTRLEVPFALPVGLQVLEKSGRGRNSSSSSGGSGGKYVELQGPSLRAKLPLSLVYALS